MKSGKAYSILHETCEIDPNTKTRTPYAFYCFQLIFKVVWNQEKWKILFDYGIKNSLLDSKCKLL